MLAILLIISPLTSGLILNDIKAVHRGSFQAEIGVRANDTIFVLDGDFRDFRGRHVVYGLVSPVDSDRSVRFQGFISRNLFIIQSGVRNHIVNIIGRFNEYDEDQDLASGNWRGFIAGVGRANGWISARLTS